MNDVLDEVFAIAAFLLHWVMLPVALCLVRFCYGLLFSSSKLSITFSFLDEAQLYFEQWLHKGWHSFLPTAETRQTALLLFVLPVTHVDGFPNPMLPCSHLSLVLFLKMSSNNDYSTWSIFTSSEEGAFLLLGNAMKSGIMGL